MNYIILLVLLVLLILLSVFLITFINSNNVENFGSSAIRFFDLLRLITGVKK